jgi:hypothetical protein
MPNGEISQRAELRHHLPVMHDRPGDQLREKQHEQAVVEQILVLDAACVAIDEIGDFLEGEKTDRQWQHHIRQGQRPPGQGIEILDEKIRILEIRQHREIDGDAADQQCLARADAGSRRAARPVIGRGIGGGRRFRQSGADAEVEQDQQQNQRNVARVPVPVENQAGQRQPGLAQPRQLHPVGEKIKAEGDRQKNENEIPGIEKHVGDGLCVARRREMGRAEHARWRRAPRRAGAQLIAVRTAAMIS